MMNKIYNASNNTTCASAFYTKMKRGMAYGTYQRQNLWKSDMFPSFIISFINGIQPMPIVTNRRENEPLKHYIIDGGHRTRAILGFMDGAFGIEKGGQFMFYKEPSDIIKVKYTIFDENQRDIFGDLAIPTQSYSGLTADQEHDIFTDLNKQVPLSKGQQIKAIDNTAVHMIYELCIDTWEMARKVLDKRTSKEEGEAYLETLTPIFTSAIMNVGGYEISFNTAKYINRATIEDLNNMPMFSQAVRDSLDVCQMIINRAYTFGKTYQTTMVRKAYFLPIVKARLDGAPVSRILKNFEMIDYNTDHDWYDWMPSTGMNSKKYVNKRAECLCAP